MKNKYFYTAISSLFLTIGFASNSSATYEISQLSDVAATLKNIHYLRANEVGDAVFSENGTGTYIYNGLDNTVTNSGLNNALGSIGSINNKRDFTYMGRTSTRNVYESMLYTTSTGTGTSVNTLTGVSSIGQTLVNDKGDLGFTVGNTWPLYGVGFYDNSTGLYSELSALSYAGFIEDMNNNGDVVWTTFSGTYLYDYVTGTTSKVAPFNGGYAWGPYSYANMNDNQDIAFSDRAQRHYWTNQNGDQSYTWVWTANVYLADTGEILTLGECGSGRTPIINNNGQAVFLEEDIRNKYAVLYGNGEIEIYNPDEIVIYDLNTGDTTQITDNTAGLSFNSMNHHSQTPINNKGDVAYVGHDTANPNNHSLMVYRASDQTTELVVATVDAVIDDLHINDNGDLFWIQIDKTAPYFQNAYKATFILTISDIIELVDEVLITGEITNKGIANSLTSLLNNALAAEERENIIAATNKLQAFINSTNAKRGKSITDEAADKLIQSAQAVIDNM